MLERPDDLRFLAYPLPEDVRRLSDAGDIDRARRVIALRLEDPRVPAALKRRLAFELRVLEQLPHTYPLTEDAAFARLSRAVAGVTRAEMEGYRDDGTLDWAYVGGQVRYKGDCVDSLIKTRPELNARILDRAALDAKYAGIRALDDAIADMKWNGHARVRCKLRMTLTLSEEAERVGERIRVYMPLPLRDAQCAPISVRTSPAAFVAPEDAAQRTAYFEKIYQSGDAFETVSTFEIDAPYRDAAGAARAMAAGEKAGAVAPLQASLAASLTAEQPPQIRFTPYLRALRDELAGAETRPLALARRYYDFITTKAAYRYVPPYFTKPMIPEYFGAGMRGDCGMQALLFITLCRMSGIPAEWQAGLYVRDGAIGNHDWARFWCEPFGWLFCDPSFGGSAWHEGHHARWDFYFGNLDPFRMVANRGFQRDFDPPCPFARFDPYDNQSGEAAFGDTAIPHRLLNLRREILSWETLA